MFNTTVTCPQCRTPFTAKVEQIFDVGRDPAAKGRFLRGNFNVITCPRCGFQSMMAAPIVYHDPAKELMLSYVPMELGLPQAEQDRMLGTLTRAILNDLPPEERKGYLLKPSMPFLTLQSMIEKVLEGDGVTKEMLEAQRGKIKLVETFLTAKSDEAVTRLVQEHDAELDYAFFEIFTSAIQSAAEQGDRASAEKMLDTRNKIVEQSSLGRKSNEQARMLEGIAEELNALGEKLTPELFFDMVVKAGTTERAIAIVTLARPLVNYDFFMKLTTHINQAPEKERTRLQELRELILDTVGRVDQVAQQQVQQTQGLLQALLEAPDLKQAIQQNLGMIDNAFMTVLSQNYDAARKANRTDVAEKLQKIGDTILELIRDSAPPEVRLINELLNFETEEESLAEVKRRSVEITPQVVEAMKSILEEVQAGGRAEVADRLTKIIAAADRQAVMSKWTT
jgi:CpXC protein